MQPNDDNRTGKQYHDELIWVEISRSALENNIREFRRILSRGSLLCACVKANAYGHGLVQAAQIFTGA
ncbi:MAG: alanine racemase, partial [Desulfobacterota bacterium]|nr:alanine racemase [Thermodesulfobacteriota bacterium]